jgi:hypothetical protein
MATRTQRRMGTKANRARHDREYRERQRQRRRANLARKLFRLMAGWRTV